MSGSSNYNNYSPWNQSPGPGAPQPQQMMSNSPPTATAPPSAYPPNAQQGPVPSVQTNPFLGSPYQTYPSGYPPGYPPTTQNPFASTSPSNPFLAPQGDPISQPPSSVLSSVGKAPPPRPKSMAPTGASEPTRVPSLPPSRPKSLPPSAFDVPQLPSQPVQQSPPLVAGPTDITESISSSEEDSAEVQLDAVEVDSVVSSSSGVPIRAQDPPAPTPSYPQNSMSTEPPLPAKLEKIHNKASRAAHDHSARLARFSPLLNPQFDKQLLYSLESQLTVDDRRMRYKQLDYVTLEEIVPWSLYSQHLSSPLSAEAKQLRFKQVLADERSWRKIPDGVLPADDDVYEEEPTDYNVAPRDDLNSKISLWQGDITRLEIDAIVNAANETLLGGGGIDGAIHSAAGDSLRDECATLNGASVGETKVTLGHALPSRFIFHTVGPRADEQYYHLPKQELRSCYETCLSLMAPNGVRSIAFCAISTGIFGYPIENATHTALKSVRKWLELSNNAEKVDRIIFCVFSDRDRSVYEEALQVFFPVSNSPRNTVDFPFVRSSLELLQSSLMTRTIKSLEDFTSFVRSFPGNERLDLAGLHMFYNNYQSQSQQALFLRAVQQAQVFFGRMVASLLDGRITLPYLDRLSDSSAQISRDIVPLLLAYAFFCFDKRFNFSGLFKRTNSDSPSNPLDHEGAFYSETQAAKLECLVNYFNTVSKSPQSAQPLSIARQSYRGQLPRFDQSKASLITYSKDAYYPLDKQTAPGILQVYAVKELLSREALAPYSFSHLKLASASGTTLFERRCFACPELLLLPLILAPLLPFESVQVSGVIPTNLTLDSDTAYFSFGGSEKLPDGQKTFPESSLLLIPAVATRADSELSERKYNICKGLNRIYSALVASQRGLVSRGFGARLQIAVSNYGGEEYFGSSADTGCLLMLLACSQLNEEKSAYQDVSLRFCDPSFETGGPFDKTIRLFLEQETVRLLHVYRQVIGALPPSKYVPALEDKKPGLWKQLHHRFTSWKVDEARERQERERAEYEAAKKQMKKDAEERRNHDVPLPKSSSSLSQPSPQIPTRSGSKSPRESLPSSPQIPSASALQSTGKSRGFRGNVKVTVESARGLRGADVGGTSDPFAQVTWQGLVYETQAIPKTTSPVWNWSFEAYVDSGTEQPLELFRIEVWDKDPIGKKFLGMAYREIDVSQKTLLEVPLTGRPQSRDKADKLVTGSILLRIEPQS